MWEGTLAHTCNPSYSGGRDQEDRSSNSLQAKKLVRPQLHKKLGMMVCTCDPSYTGGITRRTVVQASLEENVKHYLKNK
jgi:hypothetical protein